MKAGGGQADYPADFEHLDPGMLRDGDLELVLAEKHPAEPERGYVPWYGFEMRCGGRRAGHLNLRIGHTESLYYAGHIGYAVEPEFRGNHFAERSCRLVLPLVRAHGLAQLAITCNPENAASRRTIERLGARLEAIVDLPEHNEMYKEGDRRKCHYVLDL